MSSPVALRFAGALVWSSLGLMVGCAQDPAPTQTSSPDGSVPLDDGDSGRLRDDAGEDFVPEPHCGFSTGKLDLLLVIDNSGSMAAEQYLLSRELPRMVRALSSGDVDGDGVQDHPKADLHVGVISTDMGLSGDVHPGNNECRALGDDGLLRNPPACEHLPTGYLAYAPGAAAGESLEQVLACQVQLGVDGCGFEQPLEAMLKALTPSTSPVRFTFGTQGHGDGKNAGFLREDSILAIVQVTDEDDCSFEGPNLPFSSVGQEPPYEGVGINYRCMAFPEVAYPTSRYVEQLRALRPDVDGAIFFAVIAGVPPELTRGSHSIAQMLEHSSMAYQPEGELAYAKPKPACTARHGTPKGVEEVAAAPARRLLEVAQAFGEHAVVASICEETFQAPIEAIAKRIGGVLACPSDPVLY